MDGEANRRRIPVDDRMSRRSPASISLLAQQELCAVTEIAGSTDRNDHPLAGRGTVTLIGGCMFSGKTTELLRRLRACPPDATMVFKPVIDRRYRADAVVTHGGLAIPAISVRSADDLSSRLHSRIEIVALDEAHFFEPDLADLVGRLASDGVSVLLTALDRDSWGGPFLVIERLLALADEAIIRHATCARCGENADRTQRLTPITEGNMVGGAESYEPRCRSCWHPPPEPPPLIS